MKGFCWKVELLNEILCSLSVRINNIQEIHWRKENEHKTPVYDYALLELEYFDKIDLSNAHC